MTTGRRRAVLVAVTVAFCVDMLVYGMVVPVLPDLARTAQLGHFGVGVVFGCYGAAYVVATPLAGRLVDVHGARPIMLAGAIVLALSTFVFACATDTSTLVISRLLQGAGAAATWVGGYAVLTKAFGRDQRSTAVATASIGTALGLVLGPPVGGLLVEFGGVRTPFLFAAVLSVAVLALLAVTVPTSACHREVDSAPAHGRALSIMTLAPWLAAALSAGLALGAVESQLPLTLSIHFDATATQIGLLFAFTAVMFTVGSLAAGRRAADHPRGHVAAVGWVAVCVALVGLGVLDSVIGLAAVMALLGAGLGAMVATVMPALADVFEDAADGRVGTAAAAYNLCFSAGMVAGPLIAGLVSETASVRAAAAATALATIGLGVAALAVRRHLIRRSPVAERAT